ncbi:hypothetical protein [Propionivibrio sp.]
MKRPFTSDAERNGSYRPLLGKAEDGGQIKPPASFKLSQVDEFRIANAP